VGDELVDFWNAHFTRVAFVVEKDIFVDPFELGFFGRGLVLLEAELIAKLIEQFFRVLFHRVFSRKTLWLYNLSIGYYTANRLSKPSILGV